ncbi:MAG: hypothetical protein AABY33_00050 [Pseudomonadota bacterium]
MAFFGLFGNDEEEVQQPQRRSGGIGSFLMGALKTGLIIIGAILTLGGIFAVSETAKGFADKHMNNLGTGTLDLIKGGWNKVTGMLGFSNTPTSDSVSETVKLGERETIIPKKDKDSLLGDITVTNSEIRRKLNDREKAFAEINNPKNLYTAEQKSVEFAKLEELPAISFALADKSVVWDTTARNVNSKNYGSGLPDVPLINLEARLPMIPEKFNKFGREKASDTWDGLSPISKIKYLHTAVKEAAANKPDLGERSLKEDAGILSGSIREIFLPDKVISKEESSAIVRHIPILSAIFQGKEHITDKGVEITGKEKIGELLAKGDLDSALAISNGIQAKFLKTAENIPALTQNNDGTWIELNKDDKLRAEKQMLLYKGASESFGKISKYIEAKQMERDYDKQVGNPTHSVIADVAGSIPTIFKDYEQKIANFKAGGTSGQPLAATQSPTNPSGQRDDTTDKDEKAKAAALEAMKVATAEIAAAAAKNNPAGTPIKIEKREKGTGK